jgi:DNA-binding transcriptional ArsR family regulator
MSRETVNAGSGGDARLRLVRELADPLRLRVLDRLMQSGPTTVSRLAAELEVPLPQLSNHLRRLREAGLVSVDRVGRQAIYALADPGLEQLLPMLDSITGRVLSRTKTTTRAPAVPSRTCYDHLAGRIGVGLYRALCARGALGAHSDGTVELGPQAAPTFAALGVQVAEIAPGRQRLAFECLDATERAPHLAGALGDAVADATISRGWLRREPGGRTITLTPAGRRGFRAALGVSL